MGIILYCDNTKYYMSYKIWNKIKNYLGIISIKYLEKLINQNNYLNYSSIDSNISLNYLLNNKNSIFFLSNLILFYENNFQNIIKLQLQGIYSFIKQKQLSYSYTFNESINFINSINSINSIKTLLDTETDTEMDTYVNNIYNIYKYSVDNNLPLHIS